MKKISLIILILYIFTSNVFSHNGHVHQYITREAYKLLKLQTGCDIPIMKDHVGYVEGYTGNSKWSTGLISAGAWREDDEDVVFRYSMNNTPFHNGFQNWGMNNILSIFSANNDPLVTCTHFWEPDAGDNTLTNIWADLFGFYCENAFDKISRFKNGGYDYNNGGWCLEWRDEIIAIKPNGEVLSIRWSGFDPYNGYFIYYNNLIDLFKYKKMRIIPYSQYWTNIDMTNLTLNRKELYLGDFIISDNLRDMIVWEILGRMCHLLQDMSVPTHAHADIHGSTYLSILNDSYETWYGYNYYWNAQNVYSNFGGIIDPYVSSNPIHYLMYTSAQISDHFGSNGPQIYGNGDDYIGGNPLSEETIYLNTVLPFLASVIDGINIMNQRDDSQFTENIKTYIRDKTLPYSIRATAGLLYWFAKETGIMPLTVPGMYPTIEQAINASTSGQTIIVTSGTFNYSTNLTVPAERTLQINSGVTINFNSNSTLIVTGTLKTESGSIITFNGASSQLTVSGSMIAESSTFQGNGTIGSWFGIQINSTGSANLNNCTIRDAQYGIFSNKNIIVDECNFNNNIVHAYFSSAGQPMIKNCKFENNVNNDTYVGIWCENNSSPVIGPRCLFQNIFSSAVYGDETSIPYLGSLLGYNSFRLSCGWHVGSTYNGTIDATRNWWGNNPPPGRVDNNVDCSLYLTSDPIFSIKQDPITIKPGDIIMSKKNSITPETEDNPYKEIDKAYKLMIEKKYSESFPILEKVISEYTDDLPGRISIVLYEECMKGSGLSDYISGKLDLFKNNIKSDKDSRFIDSRLANQMIAGKDFDRAINLSKDIVSASKDKSVLKTTLYELGNLYWYQKGDKKNGEIYYRQLIKTYPESPLSHSALSTLGEYKPGNGKETKPVGESGKAITELNIKNYPNPFNPSTKIEYSLPENTNVSIIIYNSLGQEIAKLVDGFKEKGVYSITWNPNNISSGIYYYKIRTDKSTLLNKMIFMK